MHMSKSFQLALHFIKGPSQSSLWETFSAFHLFLNGMNTRMAPDFRHVTLAEIHGGAEWAEPSSLVVTRDTGEQQPSRACSLADWPLRQCWSWSLLKIDRLMEESASNAHPSRIQGWCLDLMSHTQRKLMHVSPQHATQHIDVFDRMSELLFLHFLLTILTNFWML